LTVTSYGTAEEFLAEAHAPKAPCCLIVDLCMPGLSGLELQDLLRQYDLDMSVIFISGRADVGQSVRAMKGGATDFLVKPVSAHLLLPAVEQALARDQERRQTKEEEQRLRGRLSTLSTREREVFELVVKGLLNKQMAAELGILEGTIKVHRARVMQKMRAESLADLVRFAERLKQGGGLDGRAEIAAGAIRGERLETGH
jgi:RNA polymerase sigma factor (sigma-70 family)